MPVKWKVVLTVIGILLLWKLASYSGIFRSETKPLVYPNTIVKRIDDYPSVRLTVYYEALCSDSRNFILNQLVPTFEDLGRYIVLDLIPYGKAKTMENDGKITFQCQHGNVECLANRVHACVLDKITNSFLRVKYIACMIADNIVPEEAGDRCAKEIGYDYRHVAECVNSDYSNKLLKAYGILTQAVVPHITFIPTVEVDGSQRIPLAHLLKDLKHELCKVLPPEVEECNKKK